MRCPKCGKTLPGGMQLCCYCRYDLRSVHTRSTAVDPESGQGPSHVAEMDGAVRAAGADPLAPDPGMRPVNDSGAHEDNPSASPIQHNNSFEAERAAALNTMLGAGGTSTPSDSCDSSNHVTSHVVIRSRIDKELKMPSSAPAAQTGSMPSSSRTKKRGVSSTLAGFLVTGTIVAIVAAAGAYVQSLGENPAPPAQGATEPIEASTANVAYVKSPYETGADEYVLPYSDSYCYSTEELSILDSFGLYVARNEIFARHGFIFGRDDLKEYFSSKSWYVPTYTPEEYETLPSPTNDIENQNVQTILSLERSNESPYI